MKAFICALFDPTTRKAVYVGRPLIEFPPVSGVTAGYPRVVREWAASLPQPPTEVVLETCPYHDDLTREENDRAVSATVQKWRAWLSEGAELRPWPAGDTDD